MTREIRDRIGAASGAAFVVLVLAGNSLATAGTSGATHPSGEQVLRDVAKQAESTGAAIGLALEVLAFTAFLLFTGWAAGHLRRRTANVAADILLAAGVTMAAVKLASAAPAMALALDHKTLSPELAQVLNDVNGAAFVVSWLPYAVLVAALAAGLLAARAVGRPTAGVGLFLGVVGVVLAVLGFGSPDTANPMAFLLGLVWLLVVSVRLMVLPARESTGDTRENADLRVPITAR